MKRLSGGIDIGKDFHQMIILDDQEQVFYQKKLAHNLGEMKETMKELTCLEKKEKAKLSFAIEGKNGYSNPLDRLLFLEGFTLYNVRETKGIGLHIWHSECRKTNGKFRSWNISFFNEYYLNSSVYFFSVSYIINNYNIFFSIYKIDNSIITNSNSINFVCTWSLRV